MHRRLITSPLASKSPIYRFSTIAVVSGSVARDVETAKIIQGLQKSLGSVQFVGIGGPAVQPLLRQTFATSESFLKYPLEVTHNYDEKSSDSYLLPYRTPVHYKNHLVLKDLSSKNVYQTLSDLNISAVVNVGNFAFTKRFNNNLRNHYYDIKKVAPPSFLYDKLIDCRRVENEAFLDFQFFNLPRRIESWSGYVFPSMCVGYQGLFEAYRFLAKYRTDGGSTSFKLPNFSVAVNSMVQQARADFRAKHQISPDAYVTAFYAGEEPHQIEFSAKSLNKALGVFLGSSQVKAFDKSVFELFVVLPENKSYAGLAKKAASNASNGLKITFVEHADRFGAYSAADFGVLHDGEATVEAAGCQLATTVLNSCSALYAYAANVINMFESPLNVTLKKLGYQELLSAPTANSDLLGISMQDHFRDPKLKFYYIETYEKALQDMLAKSGRNPNLDVAESGYETSYNVLTDYVNKYEALDKSAVDYNWGKRRQTITP